MRVFAPIGVSHPSDSWHWGVGTKGGRLKLIYRIPVGVVSPGAILDEKLTSVVWPATASGCRPFFSHDV